MKKPMDIAPDTLLDVAEALHARGLQTVTEARAYGSVLSADAKGRPLTVTGLAETIGEPISSVSRIAFRLSELGVIRHDRTASDRRKVILRGA